jgi:hypothetical protein
MSHQESHGGIIVEEGDEHPSHLNIEGQNAQHTNAAGEAYRVNHHIVKRMRKREGGNLSWRNMLITVSHSFLRRPTPLIFLILFVRLQKMEEEICRNWS